MSLFRQLNQALSQCSQQNLALSIPPNTGVYLRKTLCVEVGTKCADHFPDSKRNTGALSHLHYAAELTHKCSTIFWKHVCTFMEEGTHEHHKTKCLFLSTLQITQLFLSIPHKKTLMHFLRILGKLSVCFVHRENLDMSLHGNYLPFCCYSSWWYSKQCYQYSLMSIFFFFFFIKNSTLFWLLLNFKATLLN